MTWPILYCCSHSHLPDKDGVIRLHLDNDSLFTVDHPYLVCYQSTLAKNTKKPRPRTIPNHYYQEVGDFDARLVTPPEVFALRDFSHQFKVKSYLLRHLLTVRTEWSKKM